MWNVKFQRFLWIFSKIGRNSKKWKKPILDNFILFSKINESHFLIKPNCCYAVQEKLDGYHGYWWISRKPHNFTKSVATIGFIWFFWFHKYILLFIFVQIFLVMRCIRSHLFWLGLTPTLKGTWFDFSKWKCMLCLENNHSYDENFKTQFDRSHPLFGCTKPFCLLQLPIHYYVSLIMVIQ